MNEAMTMVLRAMGLTDNAATLVGSWPANYVTVAKAANLYDDVDAVTTVDRATAAQIIYNAIKAPGYVVNADGLVGSAPSMLVGLGATPVKKVVDANDYDGTLIALGDYIGSYGTIYTNSDNEVVAVDVASTLLSGKFTTTGAFEADEVEYKINETTAGAYTVTNAVVGGTATTAIPTTSNAVTIAADISGKTITEIYSIITWDATANNSNVVYIEDEDVLEAFQEDLAEDTPCIGAAVFDLDTSDEIVATSYKLLGVADLADVKVGNVVYTYDNGTNIVKIEVGTETVTGKVTKINSDGDYVINGTAYAVAAEANGADYTDLAAGAEGTAYLNYAGEIIAFEGDKPETGNYAVYVGNKVTTGFSNDSDVVTIKLFLPDGTEITPDLDGDKVTTTAGIGADVWVDYALDKNGDVEALTTGGVATAINGLDVTNGGKLIGTYKVAKDVVVITDDSTDGLALGKIADLADTITASAIVDDNNTITHLLVDTTYTGSESESVGVVTAYGEIGIDADDNAVTLAAIILDGVVKTDVITNVEISTSTALKAIKVNEDGEITTVTAVTTDSATIVATTIEAVDGALVTYNDGSQKTIEVTADVTVLVYDTEDDAWTIGKTSAIKNKNNTSVTFYDTVDDDEAVYNYVVVVK